MEQMKNFKKYLAESAKDHVYIIKFAMKPTEEQVEVIENWLNRFDLKSSSELAEIENDRKDFIDVPNRVVYVMEVTLGTPVSQYILLQDLKIAANISEDHMVVRSSDEPIQIYAEIDSWKRSQNAAAKKAGNVNAARLSTDRLYTDAEQPPVQNLYGNEYNKNFLAYLASVEESRPSQVVEPPCPLFSWIKEEVAPGEPQQDTSDFNQHIDTPKPTTKGSNKSPVNSMYTDSHGQMANSSIPIVKFTKNKKTGKAKQTVMPVRKD